MPPSGGFVLLDVDQLDVRSERPDLIFEVQDPVEGLIEPAAQLVHALRRTVDASHRAVFEDGGRHGVTLAPPSVGFVTKMASARDPFPGACRIPMRYRSPSSREG